MSPNSSLLQSSNSSESNQSDEMLFEPSDYLMLSDTEMEMQEQFVSTTSEHRRDPFLLQANDEHHISKSSIGDFSQSRNLVKSSSKGSIMKIAFKTKSELEVLDDGYKWRKYGKKMVKNSPNPRNYYRCSTEGCYVKKRVEREREDSSYVITTYEGIHNHHAPSATKSRTSAPDSPSSYLA